MVEVVDAQVHGNAIAPELTAGDLHAGVEATVAAMNAVGVDAAVLDDYWGVDEEFRMLPGHEGPKGVWRGDQPFSEAAVAAYPKRFAYVVRLDYRDADLAEKLGALHSAPGCLALRLTKADGKNRIWDDPAFAEGAYAPLFQHAEANRVPLFVLASARLDLLEPYVQRFPDLWFILDHLGVPYPAAGASPKERYARLDTLCAISAYPNVALKWSHVERLAAEPYPYRDAMPHFRRVVDAFGPERVMWASDHTQARDPSLSPHPSSWAQSLHYLADSELFSEMEKEWMLGRTVRALLGWDR
jgi:L-fuconolactonase